MSWASAIGLGARIETAASGAAGQLAATFEGRKPDLAIVFASSAYGESIEDLPQILRSLLGDCLLFGCNAAGLIGGGIEEEEEPGIAVLCGRLPDVTLSTLHLEQATLPSLAASRERWWRKLDLGPESSASFVLLADAATFDAEACARGLDRAYPGAAVIGALSSGSRAPGAARLLANDGLQSAGGALLALTGNVIIDTVLAQGCKPIGDPLFVTACDGNLISELDGRRPKELLTSLFTQLDEPDRSGFGDSLCIGLALPGPRQSVGAGDFLIRNVLGLDPETGALWVGARLAPNAIVQFHLRDSGIASQELESRLGESLTARPPPEAALLFACAGRGRNLFGITGHDSGTLRRRIDIPVAGMFSAGEIAPVQGVTFLHSFSSAFGLIRRRTAPTP